MPAVEHAQGSHQCRRRPGPGRPSTRIWSSGWSTVPPSPSRCARSDRSVTARWSHKGSSPPSRARWSPRTATTGPAAAGRASAVQPSASSTAWSRRKVSGCTVSGSKTAPAASTDPVGSSTSGCATAWAGSASVPASATAAAVSGSTCPSTSTTRSPVVAANPTLAVVAVPRSAWIVTRLEPGDAVVSTDSATCCQRGSRTPTTTSSTSTAGVAASASATLRIQRAVGRTAPSAGSTTLVRPGTRSAGDRGRPVDEVARGDDREPGRRLLRADPRSGVVGLVVDVVDADVAHQVQVGGPRELEDQVVVDSAAQALVEAADRLDQLTAHDQHVEVDVVGDQQVVVVALEGAEVLLAVLAGPQRGMRHAPVGVGLQLGEHHLQVVGPPLVVGVEEGDVAAPGAGQAAVAGGRHAAVPAPRPRRSARRRLPCRSRRRRSRPSNRRRPRSAPSRGGSAPAPTRSRPGPPWRGSTAASRC